MKSNVAERIFWLLGMCSVCGDVLQSVELASDMLINAIKLFEILEGDKHVIKGLAHS